MYNVEITWRDDGDNTLYEGVTHKPELDFFDNNPFLVLNLESMPNLRNDLVTVFIRKDDIKMIDVFKYNENGVDDE